MFAESRYVPSDTLKSELEKLPDRLEGTWAILVLDAGAVLSPEELEWVRPLVGRWGQVTQESQGLAFWVDCYGNDGIGIHIERVGKRVRVHLENQDTWDFDVGEVQAVPDGSITLRMLNGVTLKHARSSDDKRVSRWTGVADTFGPVDGLYVHSDVMDAFPTVEPGPGECDN